jgi:sulfite reductase (NADPH) hemoprotein beta-component
VEHGRVCDENNLDMKTCMLEIAKTGKVNVRFTCNQNLIVSDVDAKDKDAVDAILEKYGLKKHTEASSALRRNSVACVALPNCPLAFAEGQRYLPVLISKLEPILEKHNLSSQEIIIRMTGCPNGCARPYLAEIALVGVSAGIYNLHLGGDVQGQRLNKIYKHNVDEEGILAALEPVFASYSKERSNEESFGDFVMRKQLV